MAKKSIEHQHSKLSARTARTDETREPLGLVTRRPPALLPKSFRLRAADLQRLSATMEKLREQYPDKRLGETDLIRGLLVIGEKTSQERLIAAIRESMI